MQLFFCDSSMTISKGLQLIEYIVTNILPIKVSGV